MIAPTLLLAATLAQGGLMDMDLDKDGFVSPAEHAEGAGKMFDAMDNDGDGRVGAAEMTASHEKITGKPAAPGELSSEEKIAAIDADTDGVLTAQEHADGAMSMFRAMDTDADGRLSPAEIEAGHAAHLKKP